MQPRARFRLAKPASRGARPSTRFSPVNLDAMGDPAADVVVVGAGVIGLTTAICVAEAGMTVLVISAEQPRQTTSAAAGALWGPHLVGMDERIGRWAAVTLERLQELRAPRVGASALAGIARTVPGIAATATADG